MDYPNTYDSQDIYLICYVPNNIDLTSIEDGVPVVAEGEYKESDSMAPVALLTII